jgi:hypothetical protein
VKINELEKKKEALKLKKSRLEHQERLLKLKERKNRTRILIEIGGLASKAEIDHLNTNTLLGAFLEIKEKEKEEGMLKRWTKKGAEAFDLDREKNGEPLIVTFNQEPEKPIKNEIRQAGLRWNRFRKEWQGFAKRATLEKVLKGTEHQIQALGADSKETSKGEGWFLRKKF